jgi:aminoglycoside 2''-phosphotransferase
VYSLKEIRKMIQDDLPDFFMSSIKRSGEGDHYIAYRINKKYIFRFPKNEAAKKALQKEIALMPVVASNVSLNVPDFKFISSHLLFVGYRRLQGKPLTFKRFDALVKKQKNEVIRSLSNFLYQLHHTTISQEQQAICPVMHYAAEYHETFEETQKEIFPLLNKKEIELITSIFTNYFSDSTMSNYSPVLLHNDFSSGHILYKRRSGLSGIIDFGDLAIGDADYDLVYLYDEFGKSFIKKILTCYHRDQRANIWKKLRFYSLMIRLQILAVSITENDKAEIKKELKSLKKYVRNFDKRESE